MISAPNNPELIDRLAAEYVLGTLRGAARRRLERWRITSTPVDQRCVFWEGRLTPLLLKDLKPVNPPARLWRGIRDRIAPGGPMTRRSAVRNLALAASVLLVVVLAALWYRRELVPERATEVATITAPSGMIWQVEVFARAGEPPRLAVRAGATAARPSGHDYELWALPQGGKPVSLGVLPYAQGSLRRQLTAGELQALGRSTQLAVSLEPPGGSPTGQPTGAIVFIVPLQRAG
jgi:anti-sigma-K factor RskA